jgi:hypothetical protein
LVKFWSRPQDLPGLVALSLPKTIKTSPAVGWVRANTVASEQILIELNELRKENAALRTQIAEMPTAQRIKVEGLAGLDENFRINGSYQSRGQTIAWTSTATWRDIFSFIAPYLMKNPNDATVKFSLRNALLERDGWNSLDTK